MKRLALFFIFTCTFQITMSSQSCLPEGIIFTTQTEIDSFQVNYPNCTEIEGNVVIYGNEINSLNGLDVLISIGGDLLIKSTYILKVLSGLNNLESISGSLQVGNLYFGSYPYCTGNTGLTSLAGLNSLTHIGQNLRIVCNYKLASLSGLDNLAIVEGDIEIGSIDYLYGFKFGNDSLYDFGGLSKLEEVGGNFTIAGNDHLVNFEGLNMLAVISGNFWTAWNDALEDFSGLDQLDSVGGSVDIRRNNSLTSLKGLENLSTVNDGLKIGGSYDGNPSLSDITALNNLTSIGGNLEIRDNDVLANLSGLENIEAESIVDLTIVKNSSLTTCDVYSICQYLTSPNGSITIYDNASGCNSEEELEELCGISIIENDFIKNITIHPNPFRSSATIEYELIKPSTVQLTIYDYLGKQLEVIEKKQAQRKQQIIWNAEGLPAGIYFCVIKTNQGTQTIKLIKL